MRRERLLALATLALASGSSFSCMVGPKYHVPPADTPPVFKEPVGPGAREAEGQWREAHPSDDQRRGKWWEAFQVPELSALEEKVDVQNQTVAGALATFTAARALVRQSRAALLPTVGTSPSVTWQHPSQELGAGAPQTEYSLPFTASWQADVFGRLRNTARSAAYGAQATAADLEATRLTIQGEVASVYFELRGQDALKALLDSTVAALRQSRDLTRARYETGVDTEEAVAQAETLLRATEAQEAGVGGQRAVFEHALAVLTGQAAATFSLPAGPLTARSPAIPPGLPSELLERRPDIAAAERRVAQANAQIGVQKAAYFPLVTFAADGGFESTSASSWLKWPARFFSLGPALAETILDFGARKAAVQQSVAQYDETVANYRQTVLVAFQQVEDGLALLHFLTEEINHQEAAVKYAERSLELAEDRYRLGIDPYLNVVTAETALLSNKESAVNLHVQELTASANLIEALGGGWQTSALPSPHEVAKNSAGK